MEASLAILSGSTCQCQPPLLSPVLDGGAFAWFLHVNEAKEKGLHPHSGWPISPGVPLLLLPSHPQPGSNLFPFR